MKTTIPCSLLQCEVIADVALGRLDQFYILDTERKYIITNVRKEHPSAKILSANCNLVEGQWEIEFTEE